MSQTSVSLTAHFDLTVGAMLLANMLVAMIDERSHAHVSMEASDEHG